MEDKTVDEILDMYLTGKYFTDDEKKKLIKNFHSSVKDKDKEKKQEMRKEKADAKLRHGTSCIGIISSDEKEVLSES